MLENMASILPIIPATLVKDNTNGNSMATIERARKIIAKITNPAKPTLPDLYHEKRLYLVSKTKNIISMINRNTLIAKLITLEYCKALIRKIKKYLPICPIANASKLSMIFVLYRKTPINAPRKKPSNSPQNQSPETVKSLLSVSVLPRRELKITKPTNPPSKAIKLNEKI